MGKITDHQYFAGFREIGNCGPLRGTGDLNFQGFLVVNRSLALVPPGVPRKKENPARVIVCDNILSSSLRSIFGVIPNEADY